MLSFAGGNFDIVYVNAHIRTNTARKYTHTDITQTNIRTNSLIQYVDTRISIGRKHTYVVV